MTLPDEFEQIPADQLDHWQDGGPTTNLMDPPEFLDEGARDKVRLWVVGVEDVVHAPKNCSFGLSRSRKELKHSNLTAGGLAYSGGELFVVDESTVVVNGDSGRYGPRNGDEMNNVLKAFLESGHRTYTTGYDTDVGEPLPLIGVKLVRVA
jgi:hypothetical protein